MAFEGRVFAQQRGERMRVGILTYHFSDNYGALYQAYALRKWFLDNACEAMFINYHPKHVEEGAPIVWALTSGAMKANLKSVFLTLMNLKSRWFGNRELMRAFSCFRRDALAVREERLRSVAEVEGSLAHFDLIVCGSDQIWNPSAQFGIDRVYFACFRTKGPVRRISYAASFGRDSLDSAYRDEARDYLQCLDAIGLRELSGIDIVKEISGRDAVCVPDPTLLLGSFEGLLRFVPRYADDYVFCYALRSADGIRSVAKLIGERLGARIMSPYNPLRRWRQIGMTILPGPVEWLARLRDARVVVTNSFHGVALSIILRKEFVAVGLLGGKRDMNARVLNLLSQVGLGNRFVSDANDGQVDELLRSPIDWMSVAPRVKAMQRVGSDYLNHQLALAASGCLADTACHEPALR